MKVDTELKKELDNIVTAYDIAQKQVTAFNKVMRQHQYDMERMKQRIAREVTVDEKDKFTNDKARNAEIASRIEADDGFKKLVDMTAQLQDNIDEETAHMKLCKMQMKAWDIATR